ncbi:3-keto-5-aminohexanoate cleavage protein [Streptomyces eurythermus]
MATEADRPVSQGSAAPSCCTASTTPLGRCSKPPSLGVDTRVGLEDTLYLPDGSPARGNAPLVRVARGLLHRHGTGGPRGGGTPG